MNKANHININKVAFRLLCLLLFLNANGIIYLLFGVTNVASPFIILCCLVLLYYGKFRYTDFNDTASVFFLFIMAILAIGTLSALFNFGSTNFHFGFLKIAYREYITGLLIFIVFYLVIRQKNEVDRVDQLLFIYYLFLAATMFGLLEPFIGLRSFYNTWLDQSRTLGLFANPNETGMQANFTLALGLGLFLKGRIKLVVAVVASLVAALTSISTFSKMAIITTVLILLFFLLYNLFRMFAQSKQIMNGYFKMVALFVGITIFILIPRAEAYIDDMSHGQKRRLNSLFELVLKGKVNNETTSYRGETFEEAYHLIKRKPLFGYGIHTFSMAGMFKHRTDIGVHNTYLKILGESGIFVFILFLWFIWLFFINGFKYWNAEWSFISLAVLLVFLSFCMSSHNLLNQKVTIGLMSFLMAFNSPTKEYEEGLVTHR